MDAEMFQAEARRIERLLYCIARSYLNDDQEAEDAVQDALIKAWEKRKALRDIHQFKPWMTRILSNRCKDILRKRKRWSFFPLEEETVQVEMPETENAVTEATWARSDGRDITLAMNQYWEFEIPDQYAGRCHFWGDVFMPEEIDWNLNAENNRMTMGEAYAPLTAKLNEILTAYGSGAMELQLRDAYTMGL